MKNKRLIILLSVFAFLVLIAVLSSTVFTVRKVSIEWATTKINFTASDEDVVGNVKKGGSVFLLDKSEIKQNLEEKYPYIKVESVEIKFPNKLVVHASERQEVFSIKVKDNKHYILDGDCKVLRVSTDAELGDAVEVQVENYTFAEKNFEVSKVANIGFVGTVINNLSYALQSYGYESVDIKNNLGGVRIDVTGHNDLLEITMRGVTIKINKISAGLYDKIKFAVTTFETKLSTTEKEQGVLTIYESGGKYYAEYDDQVSVGE